MENIPERKLKVLLLYRTFGPSVNLCGYLQLKWMAERHMIEFRDKRIMDIQKQDLQWCEVAVFVRGDALLDEWMAKACHKAGKTVVYILDDDLLNVPITMGSGPYYAQESVKRHIRRMMEYSDYFMSPSKALLEKYGGLFKDSFLLHEPSAYVIDEKQPNPDGKVHIGFAGSSDRGQDIDAILTDALTVIAEKYRDRIVIEIFGTETELSKKLHCRTIPYTESYEEYQQKVLELNWDIGLAPMPESDFHACKYYNKLVEYAGFGIAGVYSNVLPYTEGVSNRENGLLCDNTSEAWIGALSELIEDTEFRRKISRYSIRQSKSEFSVAYSAKSFDRCLQSFEITSNQGKSAIFWNFHKMQGLVSWYLEKFKKYGMATPIIAIRKVMYLMRRTRK